MANYDLELITHHIEEELQKHFDGENECGYDESFFYNGDIPINVKSEFVDIENLRVYCDITDGYYSCPSIRFIGFAKPTADLLDFSSKDYITEYDEYSEYEVDVPLNDKETTDSLLSKIDDAIEDLVRAKKEALALWADMQDRLDKLDELRSEMWLLQREFEKKLKQSKRK